MPKINYLLSSLSSRGVSGTVKEILQSYFWVNHFLVFHKNLQTQGPSIRKNENVVVKRINLDELEQIRRKESLPVEFYCDRSHNLRTLYLAYLNGEVAAIQWVVKKGEYSRFLNLSEMDLEFNYSTVLPRFRGKRIAQLLKAVIIQEYSDSEYKRMFSVVNAENIAQYKPMLELGFEPVEVLTHYGTHRPKATLRYVK